LTGLGGLTGPVFFAGGLFFTGPDLFAGAGFFLAGVALFLELLIAMAL
jgi:hypothetical protein